MHPAAWLALAIGSEIVATVSLKLSDGFTKPAPSVVVVAGYALSFYALSITLRTIPLGIVYAIWSGVGTAAIVVIGLPLPRDARRGESRRHRPDHRRGDVERSGCHERPVGRDTHPVIATEISFRSAGGSTRLSSGAVLRCRPACRRRRSAGTTRRENR